MYRTRQILRKELSIYRARHTRVIYRVKQTVYRRSPIDAHLARYHLNVNSIKDRLFRLLFETADPGPGYFHLPRDTSDEVKAHLTSEEQRVFPGLCE